MTSTAAPSLYDHPRYYDAVFGTTSKIESAFLIECFQLYAKREVKRVFEPATGSGRLLVELAKAGYDVTGCDLSEAAALYGNTRLGRLGFPKAIGVFDMTQFSLRPRVDAAFNLISSFQHLASDEAAESHLRSIADSLERGGLYIMGVQLIPTRGRRSGSEAWTGGRGALRVETDLKTVRLDRKKRLDLCRMVTTVRNGKKVHVFRENLRFRTYTADQMLRLLAKVPALQIAVTYDFTYTIAEPIVVDAVTQDAIFVLRKR